MQYDGKSGWASTTRNIDDHRELPDFFKQKKTKKWVPPKYNMTSFRSRANLGNGGSRKNSARSRKGESHAALPGDSRKKGSRMTESMVSPMKKYPFREVCDAPTVPMPHNNLKYSHYSEGKLPATHPAENFDVRDLKNKSLLSATGHDKIKLRPILHAMTADVRSRAHIDSELVMNEWLDSYDFETEKFNSLSLELEIKMKRAAVFSKQMGTPNKLRAAVACECLEKLSGVMGRYSNVFKLITGEVCNALFVNGDTEGKEEKKEEDGREELVAKYMKKTAYFEEAKRLEKERSKILKFATNLQKELENWEKEKLENDTGDRKKAAETAWGHIIQRGKKERRVAKLLHTVATAHAAFKVKNENEEDEVLKMLKQLEMLNMHEQLEVIERLLKASNIKFRSEVTALSAMSISGRGLCQTFSKVLEGKKDVPVTEIQKLLLNMSVRLYPKDRRHILAQVLTQCAVGDAEILQARVVKQKRSSIDLGVNSIEENGEEDEQDWDSESLQNMLSMVTKIELVERELSDAWQHKPTKVPSLMRRLQNEMTSLKLTIDSDFMHDKSFHKCYSEIMKHIEALAGATKNMFTAHANDTKVVRQQRMVILINTRSNLCNDIENLRGIVTHRIDPSTHALATERVAAVNALVAQLTDVEYHDLLDRLNLCDKNRATDAIERKDHANVLLKTYHGALKRMAKMTLDTFDRNFAQMDNLNLMDARVLPLPDLRHSNEEANEGGEAAEEKKKEEADKNIEGVEGDKKAVTNENNGAGSLDVGVEEHEDAVVDTTDIEDNIVERSKQKAAQQVLLAWLKFLSEPKSGEVHLKYDAENTSSFEVLADGQVLSKAISEILNHLPSSKSRIPCTGLGRVALLNTGHGKVANTLIDLRERSWTDRKKHVYASSIKNQLSYTKLLSLVFKASNAGLGAPEMLWTLDHLRTLDPDTMFSYLGFLYSTYPSMNRTQGKIETLNVALKRNHSFWEAVQLHSDGEARDITSAVSEMEEIEESMQQWTNELVQGHSMYEESRSAILGQVMNELGRRARGLETAAAANDERSHETALLIDPNKIPPSLKGTELSEIEEINDLIKENGAALYHVYRAYAAMGRNGSGTTLQKMQFISLVRDTISDGSVSSGYRTSDYGVAFDKVCTNSDKTIGVSQYMVALIIVASKYFSNASLFKSVEKYVEFILIRAKKSDIDRFRAILKESPVIRVIRKYMGRMKREFRRYTKRTKNRNAMTMKDFKGYLTDKGLINKSRSGTAQITQSVLRTIFNHVQRSSSIDVLDDDAETATGLEEDDDDELMDFREFTEAFVAIALYINSSPFVAVEQRIEQLWCEIFRRAGSARPSSPNRRPSSGSRRR